MKIFIGPLVCLYASDLVFSSPIKSSRSANSLASAAIHEPTGTSHIVDWAVNAISVPKHVLAQYGIFNPPHKIDSTKPGPANSPLNKRATVLICETTVDSPLGPDVQVIVEYLKSERWNWYCKQINDGMPYCTQLVSHGTAAIGICGPYRHQMMCQDIASELASLGAKCTRHINDDDRIGGIAVTMGRLGSMHPVFRGIVVYHNNKLGLESGKFYSRGEKPKMD